MWLGDILCRNGKYWIAQTANLGNRCRIVSQYRESSTYVAKNVYTTVSKLTKNVGKKLSNYWSILKLLYRHFLMSGWFSILSNNGTMCSCAICGMIRRIKMHNQTIKCGLSQSLWLANVIKSEWKHFWEKRSGNEFEMVLQITGFSQLRLTIMGRNGQVYFP